MFFDKNFHNRPVEILRGDILTTDQTDTEGRLLAEFDAPQSSILRSTDNGVDMSLTRRLLGGYRDNQLTSWGAMRSIAPHWNLVLNNLCWINGQYFDQNSPTDEIDIADFRVLASVGSAIASFMMLRRISPVARYGEMPVEISAIPKVSRGFMVLSEMVSSGGLDVADAFEICEANELFTSADGQRVCPGTYQMFSQAMEALCFGKKGDAHLSSLSQRITSFPNLFLYSKEYVKSIGGLIDFNNENVYPDDKIWFVGRLGKMQDKINRSLGWNPLHASRPTVEKLDDFYSQFSL